MTESRNRRFAKLAKDVDASGDITTAAIATDVSFGVDVYDSAELLPYVGNTAGDQAFVASNNRLYIWQGSGWYNVALINRAPTIASVQDSDGNTTPFILSTEGAVTTITITAADSDGDLITYSAVADSDFNGLATVSDSDNVFTITPFSQDSASTTSGTITFKATDGINIASSGIQSFILSFESAVWADTVLSIGTSSTNGLDNDTFIDRSTNARTVTPSGSPTQTAFHPYLDYWSVEFDGTNYITNTDNALISTSQSTFTVESWVYMTDNPSENDEVNVPGLIALDGEAAGTINYLSFGPVSSRVLYLRWFDGSAKTAYGSTTLDLNRWYHVSCVVNSNSIQFYVDGVAETMAGTTTLTDRNGSSTDFAIGKNSYGALNGYVSNLRVTTTAVYTSNFVPTVENFTAVTGTVLLVCQNNRFIDNSTNNYALTLANSPKVSVFNPFGQESEYAVGENKGSTYFGGSGNYLDFGQQSEYVIGTNDFDVSFWVYPEYPLNVSENPIIKMYSDGGVTLEVRLVNANISFQFGSSGSGDRTILDGSEDLRAHQWNYIRVGRDASNLYIFVNGVLDTSTSSTQNVTDTTYVFYMNSNQLGSSGREQYISDFYFSNVNGCGTSSFTPPTAPVGNTNASLYLPMDNAGIFDKTGNHTLTLVGDTATSTTQTKFADTAMYFDGSGDYLDLPSASEFDFGSGDFTIETWIYATSSLTTNNRTIIDARPASGEYSNNYLLFVSTSGKLTFGFADSTVGSEDFSTTSTLSPNNWIHVAVARSGDTIRVFVNGSAENTSNVSGKSFNSSLFRVGYRVYSTSSLTYWNGYLENFQILKGVAKYTANFTVPSQEQGRTYQAQD